MNEILIELHARDPANNRYRAWRVVAGADLFGLWTAHVNFGRIGSAGRTMRHEAAAVAFVRRDCAGGQPLSGGWESHTDRLRHHLPPTTCSL